MKLYKLVIILIAFILLLPYISSSHTAKATEYEDINLHFVVIDENDNNLKNKSLEIKIWKISEYKNFENSVVKLKELSKFTNNQLDNQFTNFSEHKTNKDGILVISNFSSGYYYVREKNYKKSDEFFTPIILELPNSNKDIFIKKTKMQEITGGYKFKKISAKDKKALAHAKFKVTKFENGSYETIIKDNKEYIVSSNEEGIFEVDGLKFGIYYLWEIDAPSGFEQLKNPIEFEVTDISKYVGEMIISNKPYTPPPIIIPNTGDILFLVLLLGGIIIFSIGYRITKSNN